jgi:hypothetical protein
MMTFDPDLWPLPPQYRKIPEDLIAFGAVQEMRLRAEQDKTYTRTCIYGEKVYYVEAYHAYAPGHIYSEEGMREYRDISGCCEFHFDAMFQERDDGLPPFGVMLDDNGTPVAIPLTAENVQQATLYPSSEGGVPITIDFTPPKEGPPWQLPDK